MIIAAMGAGLLIGLSLGALGGGGSILTVPALVYLLGQSAHQATTTSLLVVGTAALAGAASHSRAGRVRLREGAIFGALGIAGSYAGARASAAVPAELLLAGFGALMLAVAVMMITRRGSAPARVPSLETAAVSTVAVPASGTGTPQLATAAGLGTLQRTVPAARQPRTGRHPVLIAAAATGVGLITGFFGVGGGFVIVPALVLVLGFDMPAAAATSLVVIAIDSAAAIAARAAHGGMALNWTITVIFATAAIAGALAGGRLAGQVGPQRLRAAFTVLVTGVAVYTLARSLPALG